MRKILKRRIQYLCCLMVSLVNIHHVTGVFAKDAQDNIPQSREQILPSFAPVVQKTSAAVVNIYAVRVVDAQPISPFFNDPLFKHFFGEAPPFAAPHARIQRSLGSGVLVRPDGIVITNDHVIKQAAEIKVVLSDGQEFSANVVVRDARTDLAALKLKTPRADLPYLELRDPDQLKVGDIVLAIGNPFGIGQTVTMGIVSGLARSAVGIRDFRSLIQTDAAVNPGNSGGPLITLDGRIVGINTAIFSKTGEFSGVSFAIPSSLVVPVLAAVDHNGKIMRPWAGIAIQNAAKETLEGGGLPSQKGVLITKVYPDTPAERAGLKAGDVILKIDGHDIPNEAAYRFRMATAKPDQTSDFFIRRVQSTQSFSVRFEMPPEAPNNRPIEIPGRNPLSGAIVVTLSPAVATELGLAYEEQGAVVILQMRADGLAILSGFLPGDVLLKINDKPIENVEQLVRNLARSRKGWEIVFRRGERTFIQTW